MGFARIVLWGHSGLRIWLTATTVSTVIPTTSIADNDNGCGDTSVPTPFPKSRGLRSEGYYADLGLALWA